MKLETQRLILRGPRMSDAKKIQEIFNDLNILKYLVPVPYPYSIKESEKFLKEKIKKKSKENLFFVIELKKEKKVIGVISLHKINKFSGTAETGSWIGLDHQRKGYITEAKIAINDFAFNKIKLRKIKSPVFSDNKASNATQKKMGYKLEGKLKKEDKCKATGKIHDTNIYGLFKENWKKISPKLKKELKEKIKELK